MPLKIVRNDITRMQVDAIVNAANPQLCGGGGVDGAIHRGAGPELLAECLTLGGCKTGMAKITAGYKLPCKYVIHTVGPVWHGGEYGEKEALISCYRQSLKLAGEYGCKSVAFPLISAGVYGYPKDEAFRIAVQTIGDFLLHHDTSGDMVVYIVVFGRDSMRVGNRLFAQIDQYIDDRYVAAYSDSFLEQSRMICAQAAAPQRFDPRKLESDSAEQICGLPVPASLEDALQEIDESFSQMVLRKIREKNMKNSDCYKRANLDKKLFSKINNDVHYKPKKTTALALAVALELSIEETHELLRKAGLALSRSEKFDIIVEFFICSGRYDIFEINEALFHYDQALLGAVIQ